MPRRGKAGEHLLTYPYSMGKRFSQESMSAISPFRSYEQAMKAYLHLQ